MRRPLVLLFLFGCAADNGSGGMIVLSNSAAVSTCAFTGDQNQPFKTSGSLNLHSPAPYLLTPLIESKIDAIMGMELQRTIAFRGAKIDLDIVNPITTHAGTTTTTYTFDDSELAALHDEGITHFKSLFSGSLPPNGFSNVAFDLIPLQILDAIAAKIGGDTGTLSAEVVANIVVFGDLGGDEVNADKFVYPVTICTDCIIAQPIHGCPLPSGTTVRLGDPCNPFQDGIVDCCDQIDQMTGQIVITCPAEVATSM